MKKLLIETRQFNSTPVQLTEGNGLQKRGGNVFVKGILATPEEINGNGRYYKKELWEREIDKFTKKINANSTETCGELDHPDSQLINLSNASHAIRKTWWDGKHIMGLIEIFSDQGEYGTPAGRIAGALVKNGLIIGISSRGMGSLQQRGEILEVQDDFELLCWDFVSNPSNVESWFEEAQSLNESKLQQLDPYHKVNSIITDILCSNGTCPVW